MSSLDDLDALAGHAIAITRDDQTIDGAVPGLLESLGHLGGGFAGADDDGAAFGLGREMGLDGGSRLRGGNRRLE